MWRVRTNDVTAVYEYHLTFKNETRYSASKSIILEFVFWRDLPESKMPSHAPYIMPDGQSLSKYLTFETESKHASGKRRNKSRKGKRGKDEIWEHLKHQQVPSTPSSSSPPTPGLSQWWTEWISQRKRRIQNRRENGQSTSQKMVERQVLDVQIWCFLEYVFWQDVAWHDRSDDSRSNRSAILSSSLGRWPLS